MTVALTWFSASSFLAYGTACLVTRHMRAEFERFGLARQRSTVGILQVAGAAGLLAGLHVPVIGMLAAGGLALQMLLGVGVRLRIRDSLRQTGPAAFYLALNTYLFLQFLPS